MTSSQPASQAPLYLFLVPLYTDFCKMQEGNGNVLGQGIKRRKNTESDHWSDSVNDGGVDDVKNELYYIFKTIKCLGDDF